MYFPIGAVYTDFPEFHQTAMFLPERFYTAYGLLHIASSAIF
jgi:hypothetical protein